MATGMCFNIFSKTNTSKDYVLLTRIRNNFEIHQWILLRTHIYMFVRSTQKFGKLTFLLNCKVHNMTTLKEKLF